MALIFFSFVLSVSAYEAKVWLRHRSAQSAHPRSADAHPSVHSRTCRSEDLKLRWPIDGVADRDWVISNYMDLDPAVGRTLDYTGATGERAITYDGHSGLDIEVASFRAMDIGTPVVAAADGVVEEVFDESYDRNLACSSDRWNYVKVRHDNGFATVSAHLRAHSVAVQPGMRVAAGARLGLLGSSGCSRYPHVHLEVLNCLGQTLDPFKENLFLAPPPYTGHGPATLMETSLFQPAIHDVKFVQDPGVTELSSVASGMPFSIGVTISHLHKGDVLSIELITPSNAKADFDFHVSVDRDYVRSNWWADFTLDLPGSWLAQIKVNGHSLGDHAIIVQAP